MGNYLVTLSIPVYNVEKFIERALLSALSQTFGDIEFLIIDDNGQDNSMNIVYKIKDVHPRGKHIRIIKHHTNMGLGATRNTAIENARGKYLYFMDSDDYIMPNTIELLYEKALETNSDVVLGSYQSVTESKVAQKTIYPDLFVEGDFAIAKWMEKTKIYYGISSWNKLYLLSILRDNNIRCIPHHRNEDTVFTFLLLLIVKKMSTISAITYNYYYVNPASIVHQEISEFYYNQYVEIYDERKKAIIAQQGSVSETVKYYFLFPFFEFFIHKIINSSFTKEKKLHFINKMSDISFLNYNTCPLAPRDYPFLYNLIVNKKINTLAFYYKIRPILYKLRLL